jgi:hypothetical protein
MGSDDIKALLTLSITSILLYVIGFYSLLNPLKVRDVGFKIMSFFNKKRLTFFYKQRTAIMSQDWFLVYLRITGVVIILVASLALFLFIYKIRAIRS